MEELNKYLATIRIAGPEDKVYKDECVYSFDTPLSTFGLYVSLTSFHGLGRDHLERYYQKTGHHVYLNIKRTRKIISDPTDGPAKKITRLAIGEPGGFIPEEKKYSVEEVYQIVILPSFTVIQYPCSDIDEKVKASVTSILNAESATKMAEKEALSGTWDGEARVVSKHAANLLQLNNSRKIPPNGWKCDKCDLTQNLWLNLSDGSILCGRKFYDGSGGNDHAVQHYQATGFPLAVKLGTITKEGKGDVYSYDEDDMVEDPHLIEHLAHWGINIAQLEKTEKSMSELELDLNQKFGEWVALQEAASKLTPVYGPGYTGLTNLGNSCYLNSIMQTIFIIPDFIRRFVDPALDIFDANVIDPANDFEVQMAKLGVGLLSGKYSVAPDSETANEGRQGIAPRMFKTLIGRGHPGFSSNRQQDAQEFFLHLLNLLERSSRQKSNPADCFKFKIEERYECESSGNVKYSYRPEYLLPMPIPLEEAVNKDEVAAHEAEKKEAEINGRKIDSSVIVRPRIKFSSCLETISQMETIEQFYSTAINSKTNAKKITRLATFPDYLLIHLKKFTVNDDWTMVKLDVAVEMPDELDLSSLRGTGLQANEKLLPEVSSEIPTPVYNPILYSQLVDMGFPVEACKRALYFTENRGLEAATHWLLEHVMDSDFSEPFIPPGVADNSDNTQYKPNIEDLKCLLGFGFTESEATKALKATDNNVERAVDWIISHQHELDSVDMAESHKKPEEEFRDGNTNYKLVGFISHMGTSPMVGHYVCHLLKDNRWVIFNDEKVALSENPPKELGYIYVYQRITS
ncbi:ubiquitin carboxyl-terminal hydrolase 5 [Chelonus insularis]|uniref:ubiquitin carboxyl-terminal hydrolase 5 n=1 Tax=Chelonus insularis TaxID=460826 RepID=UPI00158C697A|nr:ubiquitin carboxyl-terminal hydrolase 5 [Chelonus insularis]XP_034950210.1 ubiquitin carboxyl-terminal hydrolase 5 [Chelonus insularis]